MRGSLPAGVSGSQPAGIIPAYAGLTAAQDDGHGGRRDHPRVCGAHCTYMANSGIQLGSSPRMRGSLGGLTDLVSPQGIIPAYAGLTYQQMTDAITSRDHPRVCGAHLYNRRLTAR